MNIVVPLVGGGHALVDDVDVDVLRLTWERNRNGYARHRNRRGGVDVDILLHRHVMGDPAGMIVDHKSRDRLDCRRSNLRVVTAQVNDYNRGPKGVHFVAKLGKWRVKIGGKHIGYEADESAAWVRAAQARIDLLGEHAPPWALELITRYNERSTQCECLQSLVSI